MPISKSDLQFFLTSSLPEVEQTIRSQSIGGYAATVGSGVTKSLVYPWASLTSTVGLYADLLTVGSFTNISGATLVEVNGEVMQVEAVASTSLSVKERAVNGLRRVHLPGDVVRDLSVDLFNDNLNKDFRQYRCIALKNMSETDTAYGVGVFIRSNSRNGGSKFKLAVEIPKNDRIGGTVISGSKTTLVDSSLEQYGDNFFKGAVVKFSTSDTNNGRYKVVLSFDSVSGTAVFDSALPVALAPGSGYIISPGPAQRPSTGLASPDTSSLSVSDFVEPSEGDPMDIDVSGIRTHGSDLYPGDHIYIWIERRLFRTAQAMGNNSLTIGLNYELN